MLLPLEGEALCDLAVTHQSSPGVWHSGEGQEQTGLPRAALSQSLHTHPSLSLPVREVPGCSPGQPGQRPLPRPEHRRRDLQLCTLRGGLEIGLGVLQY